MEKTVKQYMMESLIKFGRLYQLTTASPEYLETIQMALRANKWKLRDFNNALADLMNDDTYAEVARFGKYPTIHDYLRVKKLRDGQMFYKSLGAYLAGDWWERDNLKAIATPQQQNALYLLGGLEHLFARATGETPTAIYKLVDLVAKTESESPDTKLEDTLRIGSPAPIKQIMGV